MNRNLHSLPPTLNRTPFPTTCGGSIGIFHSVLTSCIAVGRWCTGSCNRRKPNEHNDVGPTGHGGRTGWVWTREPMLNARLRPTLPAVPVPPRGMTQASW